MRCEQVAYANGVARVGRHRYLVALSTVYRANSCDGDPVVEGIVRQLRQCALEHHFAIHAYCFACGEVTLLLEGLSASSALRRLIRDWKWRTTLDHRLATGRDLWHRGHIDQLVNPGARTPDVALDVMRGPLPRVVPRP